MTTSHDRVTRKARRIDGVGYVELLDGRVKRNRAPREILGTRGLVWNGRTFQEKEIK